MPEIADYQLADPLSGSELFTLDQAGVTKRASITQLGAAAGSHLVSVGELYADAGAYVGRQADRFFIGAAADNPALSNRDATPTDWLTRLMAGLPNGAWAMWGAQGASLARFGNIGFVTGSRTSDARLYTPLIGHIPPSIGHASLAFNDMDWAAPMTTPVRSYYGEATRMAGVNYQPTYVFQGEAVNFGGLPTDLGSPYAPNVGGGTYCLQLGSGGGHTSGTSDAAAVMTVVKNPSTFQRGIIFGADALSGTDGTAGSGGYATAIMLGRNQAIEFWAPDGVACYYRSKVTAASHGSHVEHTDSGIGYYNSSGQLLFGISTWSAAFAALNAQPGPTQNTAAGLYVAQGAGSPNLGLFPATGGRLEVLSPVTGGATTMPTTVTGGYLHILVNGSDFRIPLFTPNQVVGG